MRNERKWNEIIPHKSNLVALITKRRFGLERQNWRKWKWKRKENKSLLVMKKTPSSVAFYIFVTATTAISVRMVRCVIIFRHCRRCCCLASSTTSAACVCHFRNASTARCVARCFVFDVRTLTDKTKCNRFLSTECQHAFPKIFLSAILAVSLWMDWMFLFFFH